MSGEPSGRRRPWLAGVLTFIAPGVGHLYALRPLRGLGALLLSFVAVGLMIELAIGIPWKPWNVLIGVGAFLGLLFAIIDDAGRSARAVPPSSPRPRYDRWYVYVALVLAVMYGVRDPVTAAIKEHWTEAFRLPSGAMEPTLLAGDLVLVRKGRPSPGELRAGAIVVFESVNEAGIMAMSRIMGLPGDTIAMESGRFRRNGIPLHEGYTLVAEPSRREEPSVRTEMASWQAEYRVGENDELPDLNDWGPIVVPPHSVFTLGDNRDASYDGRYWGFLPVANIVGWPATVYYSYDAFAPSTLRVLNAPRWDRVGVQVE